MYVNASESLGRSYPHSAVSYCLSLSRSSGTWHHAQDGYKLVLSHCFTRFTRLHPQFWASKYYLKHPRTLTRTRFEQHHSGKMFVFPDNTQCADNLALAQVVRMHFSQLFKRAIVLHDNLLLGRLFTAAPPISVQYALKPWKEPPQKPSLPKPKKKKAPAPIHPVINWVDRFGLKEMKKAMAFKHPIGTLNLDRLSRNVRAAVLDTNIAKAILDCIRDAVRAAWETKRQCQMLIGLYLEDHFYPPPTVRLMSLDPHCHWKISASKIKPDSTICALSCTKK